MKQHFSADDRILTTHRYFKQIKMDSGKIKFSRSKFWPIADTSNFQVNKDSIEEQSSSMIKRSNRLILANIALSHYPSEWIKSRHQQIKHTASIRSIAVTTLSLEGEH